VATLKDVAREAGVSAQTVSNVVNDRAVVSTETRRRVAAAVGRLGYRPNLAARGLRQRRAGALGFLVVDPSPRYLADPFHGAVLTGLAEVARERGFGLVIEGRAPGGRALEPFRDGRIDGAVVTLGGTEAERRRHLEALARAGGPLVLLEQPAPPGDAAAVVATNREGARQATRHLLAAGHRDLAFVIPDLAWPAVEERIAGYRAALGEAKGARGVVVRCGPETPAAAGEATERLLRRHPATTAILGANDLVAVGVLRALRRLSRPCPGEIAVVGFDDFEIGRVVEPPLTTVRVPGEEMGRRAAELLVDRLRAGRFRQRLVELATELVPRESS
jgi:DNA-binding LacI/PurR family transcriptional regulator